MFELPRDPLHNACAPSISTLMHLSALMAEYKASPGQLELVRFNGGDNPLPFTSHSCEDFFSTIKEDMFFGILEEQVHIEFTGKFSEKGLSEWLRDCRQLRMSIKGDTVVSGNEYYNEFGQVLNYVGGGVAYTCNVAGMFYTSLTPDIRNPVKAGGYLPLEAFTSKDAQVQELCVLRDLVLKAELEAVMIVGISILANGVSVNSYHTQHMTLAPCPADSYDWHSSTTSVRNIRVKLCSSFWLNMKLRNAGG
jgi:hypothetical protein